MSLYFTCKEIAEEVLRKIGSFPITMSAADPDELREVLNWMDIEMAYLSGTSKLFWLIPTDPVLINLVTGQQKYKLPDAISANAPPDGIQFPVEAWLDRGNGNVTPLHIFRRDQWDAVAALGADGAPRPGDPEGVYIDRLDPPTLQTFPTVADQPTQRTIRLTVQTFGHTVGSHRVAGTGSPTYTTLTGLKASWQKWLIYQGAASAGDGTIRKLPAESLDRLDKAAAAFKKELMDFENDEFSSLPLRSESADTLMYGNDIDTDYRGDRDYSGRNRSY